MKPMNLGACMREVTNGMTSTYKEGNRKGLLVKVGKLLQPPCADGVLELHDDSFAPLLVDAVVMVADPWTLVVEGQLFSRRDVAFVAHLAKNLLQLGMDGLFGVNDFEIYVVGVEGGEEKKKRREEGEAVEVDCLVPSDALVVDACYVIVPQWVAFHIGCC